MLLYALLYVFRYSYIGILTVADPQRPDVYHVKSMSFLSCVLPRAPQRCHGDVKSSSQVMFVVIQCNCPVIQVPSKIQIWPQLPQNIMQLMCCACLDIVKNTSHCVGYVLQKRYNAITPDWCLFQNTWSHLCLFQQGFVFTLFQWILLHIFDFHIYWSFLFTGNLPIIFDLGLTQHMSNEKQETLTFWSTCSNILFMNEVSVLSILFLSCFVQGI